MSSTTRYTFKKNEKLTHKPTIDLLFKSKKKRQKRFPLSLHFIEASLNTDAPCQLLISVPKKKFRKAVHRNKIKRLIRESYRLQKHHLYQTLGNSKQLAIAIVYLHNDVQNFRAINQAVKQLLDDLNKRYSQIS